MNSLLISYALYIVCVLLIIAALPLAVIYGVLMRDDEGKIRGGTPWIMMAITFGCMLLGVGVGFLGNKVPQPKKVL